MVLDGHIHIQPGIPDPKKFHEKLDEAGVSGGIVLSLPPATFFASDPESGHVNDRLDNLFAWCADGPNLFPFFWIDPLEPDAINQIQIAVGQGVWGFKIICDRFPAHHPKAMEVFSAIAEAGKPILFHSGILWDGKASSEYNRPAVFEALLNIDRLRFSIAHISWPWCDEAIAVYGKFLNAYSRRPDLSVEMFIETTPGTPPLFRKDALTKLFMTGYDVAHNVIFGSDSCTNNYNAVWTREWIERDMTIFKELELPGRTVANVFSQNLLHFTGAIPNMKKQKQNLSPGK